MPIKPHDRRLFKLGGTRVLRLAVGKRRDDKWLAAAHMGFFAIYHKEIAPHPWGARYNSHDTVWVEKQRIGRCHKYAGAATYAKLSDFTFEEGQAVIRAMDRLIIAAPVTQRLTHRRNYGFNQMVRGNHAETS